MNPRVEEVIITEVERGSGTEKDAFRTVKQIWDKEGKLLGELDPFAPAYLPSRITDCVHGCWKIHPDSCVANIVVEKDYDKTLEIYTLLAPIIPNPPDIIPWKTRKNNQNIIVGTWAEDGTEYEIRVPGALQDAIITMQNALPMLLGEKNV